MSLQSVLAKLSEEDKREILVHLIILPTIELDKSLSQEELSNILLSGKKMGFTEKETKSAVDKEVKAIGAVIKS